MAKDGKSKSSRVATGMANSLGRTLTATDYHNLELIREGLRKHWLWYTEEMKEDDFRAIVRARIEQAKEKNAQGNKATEILFRYALGSEAPSADGGKKARIQILIEQLIQNTPAPSAEEIEAVEAIEGEWVHAPSGATADSSSPSEAEADSGRGASGEVAAQCGGAGAVRPGQCRQT